MNQDIEARARVWPAMNAAYDAAVAVIPALMENNSNDDLREAFTIGLIAALPLLATEVTASRGVVAPDATTGGSTCKDGLQVADAVLAARFLCERLDDLEWHDGQLEAVLRDYMGHVDPAHHRLKSALAVIRTTNGERP